MTDKTEGRSLARRSVELLFFVGALALLGALIHRVGVAEVGRALEGVGRVGALLIVALGMVETMLDAWALRVALPTAGRYFAVATAHCAGSFLNAVVPWDLGELVKVGFLGPGSTSERASGVVIWNYLYKLTRPITSLSFAVIGALLATGQDPTLLLFVVLANAVAFAPYLTIGLLLRAGPAATIARLLDRLRVLGGLGERVAADATELYRGLRDFRAERPGAYRTVLLTQIAARLASFLSLFAAISLLGLDYSFGTIALLYAGINVSEYVLSVIPARIGVVETAAYGLFAVYGLEPEAGLIVYLVMRLRSLAANGVIAAFALLARGGHPAVTARAARERSETPPAS